MRTEKDKACASMVPGIGEVLPEVWFRGSTLRDGELHAESLVGRVVGEGSGQREELLQRPELPGSSELGWTH